MAIQIPSYKENVLIQSQNKFTNSWFTFFAGIWSAIRLGIGLKLGGILDINTTSMANSGIGETTLISYNLAANRLINNSDSLEIRAWGTYATNGNNKTVKLKFGSQTILDTGAIAANSGSWEINATIIRTAPAIQEITTNIISSNSSVSDSSTRTAGTQNLSNAITISITAQGSADNDIVQYALIIKQNPYN